MKITIDTDEIKKTGLKVLKGAATVGAGAMLGKKIKEKADRKAIMNRKEKMRKALREKYEDVRRESEKKTLF